MDCAVMNNSFLSSKCSHFAKLSFSSNALHRNLSSRGWTAQNVSLYHDYQGSFYAGKQKSEYVDKKFWKNEVLILKSIGNHQNIVRFFSTCLCNTDRFSTIIMELCDGNLEEYVLNSAIIPLSQLSLNDELLSVEARSYFSCKILDILHQTTKGLQYLHENRTIHRAIAPSNVLLNKTSVSKTVAKLGVLDTVYNCKVVITLLSKYHLSLGLIILLYLTGTKQANAALIEACTASNQIFLLLEY